MTWVNPDKERAATTARILVGLAPAVATLRSTTRFRLRLCQRVSALPPAVPAPCLALTADGSNLLAETRLCQQSDWQQPTAKHAGRESAPGGN